MIGESFWRVMSIDNVTYGPEDIPTVEFARDDLVIPLPLTSSV